MTIANNATGKPRWNAKKFHSEHEYHEQALLEYTLTKRGKELLPTDVEPVLPRAARVGYAANVRYRRTFVEFLNRVANVFFARNPAEKFYFVTFAPRDWSFAFSKSASFDEASIRTQSQHLLDGLNYVAMIDLGWYTAGVLGVGSRPMVSPHIHALVWGNAGPKLARLQATWNRKRKTLSPGGTAFHYQSVAFDRYQEILRYSFKAPIREYRVYQKKGAGELAREAMGLRPHSPRSRQQKRSLRPGHRWSLCRVLGERSLQELCFAGGQGNLILPLAFSATNLNIGNIDEKNLTRLIGSYSQP